MIIWYEKGWIYHETRGAMAAAPSAAEGAPACPRVPQVARKLPQVKKEAKGLGGRPVGVPSYNRVEQVAMVAASLEASEAKQAQSNVDLCAVAAEKYPAQLDIMIEKYGWPVESTRQGGLWTAEKSKEVRGQPQIVWNRYNGEIKKFCMNTIQSIYVNFLVSVNSANGKDLPSGTTKDDAKKHVRQKLWEKEKMNKRQKTVDLDPPLPADGSGEDAAGSQASSPPGTESQSSQEPDIPPMPESYQGGPFCLAWEHFGPLGLGGEDSGDETGCAAFAMDSASAPAGPSRAEQRENAAGYASDASSESTHTPRGRGQAGAASRFGSLQQRENEINAYRSTLDGRRDAINEAKMLLDLAETNEEKAEALQKLRALLKTPVPTLAKE